MEFIATIQSCISIWTEGGAVKCHGTLAEPHCRINEPSCADVLATAYETLLHALLQTWCKAPNLTTESLVSFIRGLLDSLPSSSSTEEARKSHHVVLFGELLVDLIWSVDSELDEILTDARAVSSGAVETSGQTESEAKANFAKEVSGRDKETLAEFVKKLLTFGIVEPSTCRERLDMTLLTMAGLIGDRVAFEKKEIRTRTALFYKQNKFNLLREQSEGYSKLTADLIASIGPSHSPNTGFPTENRKEICARATSAWDRVVSLIGYFDLDPNRALDIIIDVFSVNIATHWQFFLALLACSPWIGGATNLRDWEVYESRMKVEIAKDAYRGKSLDDVLLMAESFAKGETTETGSSARKSNTKTKPRVLAQVLGFKFCHYQSEAKESCPRGLYLVAALLIRESFITLEDLYPHASLAPSDDDLSALKQRYLDEVQARIKMSSNNVLAMAAPLESSVPSSSTKPKVAEVKLAPQETIKEAPAQKAIMVTSLLSVGALRPAIALMTRFPWLVDVHREIADLILRVLKHSISPLYSSMFGKERNLSFLKPRSRYVSPGNVTSPTRKCHLTLCAPPPPSTLVQDFVFFFPLWSERVPLCITMDDLVDVIEPIMRFIGLHVSREPLFLTKLLRIGRTQLSQTVLTEPDSKDNKKQIPVITEPDDHIQSFWLCVTRRYLLPALSMMPGNAVCTVEVWNILKQYDTTIRWRLYGEWRDVTYKSHPELNAQRILREREAKGVLRRLSSQTVESLSGTVAKMAHSNPCIFFTNAVNQIQAYDNLADVVIQALRYATNMGFDILVFLILDALANPDKDRVKEDGANASDWLQSLATFTGALYRRYSTDLSPVLRYIVHQLYGGQTSEIIVLEKLILKMAGIEPLPSLSDAQIVAMAGGSTLRIEAVASDIRGAGFETSELSLKGTQRLGRALIETKLAFPILVQVAQQRQACAFKARDAHLKSIAHLFDATHGVLYQYLDLLTTPLAVTSDDYRSILPPLAELGTLYGLPAHICMQSMRPLFTESIVKHAREWCQIKDAEKVESAEAAEKRLKAALTAKREPSSVPSITQDTISVTRATSEGGTVEYSKDSEIMEVDTSCTADLDVKVEEQPEEQPVVESPWLPELYSLFEQCKEIAPGNAFDVIGPGFYLSFWQMSSYDLYYPKDKYEETLKALMNASELHYHKAKQAERASDKTTRLSAISHRNQRDRYLLTASDLKKEKAVQEIVHRFTTEKGGRLDKEKLHWFSHVGHGKITGAAFIQSLIEYCIQPRCLLSPMDADYCAKLIRTLHERGTPGFHTLMCYDKLLGDHVKVVIFSCSESEARNYGRFLKGILADLFSWHQSQKVYEASNRVKDGSNVALLPGFQMHWNRDGPSRPEDLLGWPGFKSFLKKCHRKLGRSFVDCIQAGDFMHVYNSVLVLKEVIEVFPMASVNEVVGSSLDLEIQRLVQNEERGDLKILARAYSSSLKKRESLWAMPKGAQAVKPPLPKPSTPVPPEKNRETAPASTPISVVAQVSKSTDVPADRSHAATSVATLESIPRPEVVKRNRPDSRPSELPSSDIPKKDPTTKEIAKQIDQTNANVPFKPTALVPAAPNTHLKQETLAQVSSQSSRPPLRPSGVSTTDLRKEVLQSVNGHSRPATPQPPQPSVADNAEPAQKPMAPPSAPSQTLSAQELRNSRASTRVERTAQSPLPESSKSPAIRSPSPATRPGTRNASTDSGRSGEKGRYERPTDSEHEEGSKRTLLSETQSRAERSGAHREVLHGRSERTNRDRIPGSSTRDLDRDRDRDRDSDRERDKGRDREKDRDREREKRDRDRESSHRERDRERDRDHRDRERERDRHRRDEKDRDRERREARGPGPDLPQETTSASRSEGSRHRAQASSAHSDDTLGKRRRPVDDEPERSSKRGSRREGHREERSRRAFEKESSRDQTREGREQGRESERRRRERDAPEETTNIRGAANEKQPDRPRGSEPSPISPAPKTPTVPPSAPRAMATQSPHLGSRGDLSPVVPMNRDKDRDNEREHDRDRSERASRSDRVDRGERTERGERSEKSDRGDRMDRGEREWKTKSEAAASQETTGGRAGVANGAAQVAQNSLLNRIGLASGGGSGLASPTPNRRAEDADARKRTLSDRERDTRDTQGDSAPRKVRIRREGLNDNGRILGKTLNSVYGSDTRGEGRRGGNN